MKEEKNQKKEKERKSNKSKKYGKAAYLQSRRGVISCWLTGWSLAILLGCVGYAFLTRGKAAGIVGGIAILSLMIDIYGIWNAIEGFEEQDRKYLSCKCGIGIGIVQILCFLGIFCWRSELMIGKLSELQKEKNEQCTQRHELAVERLRTIVTEETVNTAYISYFQDCTLFLLELENTRKKLEDGSWDSLSLEEKRSLNRILYSDIIGEKYQTSYANQDYACEKLGQEMGKPFKFVVYGNQSRNSVCV